MRVSVTTRGGFAAAVNAAAPPIVADTTALPAKQARELERLVRAATAAAPTGDTAPTARDAQSYTVVVEDDDRTVTLRTHDTAAPNAVSDLVDWVRHTGVAER